MATNPQVLQMLANPTGGGLSNAFRMYATGQQAARQQAAHEQQMQAAEYEIFDLSTKTVGGYSKSLLDWSEMYPEASPEEWADKQKELRDAMPKHVQQYIPDRTQTRDELSQGYANAMQMQKMLHPKQYENKPYSPVMLTDGTNTGVFDANTDQQKIRDFIAKNPNAREVNPPTEKAFDAITLSDGEVEQTFDANTQRAEILKFLEKHPNAREIYTRQGAASEFERLHAKQIAGTITPLEEHRLGVLAGTEMRAGTEANYNQRVKQFQHQQERQWRDEVNKGVAHLKKMDRTITEALVAFDSADMKNAETLAAQAMSQLYESDVRAYAMYQQFDQAFGNVVDRSIENIRRWFTGNRSDTEKQELKEQLVYIRDNYIQPGKTGIVDAFRIQAGLDGMRPYQVAPPESPGDIVNKDYVGLAEKGQLVKDYFPAIGRMSPEEIADSDYPLKTKENLLRALYPHRFE